jgi:hypothetical protein
MGKSFIPKDEDKKCAPNKLYTNDSCFTLESLIRIPLIHFPCSKQRNERYRSCFGIIDPICATSSLQMEI